MADLSKVSDDDLIAYKKGNFSGISDEGLFLLRGADLSAGSQRGEPGLISRIGSNIKQRASAITNPAPNSTPYLDPVISSARLGVGTASDIGAEVLKSAYHSLPDSWQENINSTVSGVIPQGAKYYAAGVSQRLPGFIEKHPTFSNIVGLATEAPVGAVVAKAAGAAGGAAKATGGILKRSNIAAGMAARGSDELDNISTAMRRESSATFKKAFDAGVVIKPDLSGKRLIDFDKSVGRISERRHGEVAGTISDMKERMAKGDMGLEDLYDFRQDFADIISDHTEITGRVKSQGRAAAKAMDAVDDMIEGLTESDVHGGIAAISDLNLGKAQWAKARTHEAVARVFTLADGDQAKIKAGFTRLKNNKKLMRGMTQKERQLIDVASRNSLNEKIMKGLGRFGIAPENVYLPMVGAGLGSMAGVGTPAGALIGAGTAARQTNKWLARGKAEKVLQAIEKRKP